MPNLVKPDKQKHRYVVGIDIGHGETSAAISSLQWDIPAKERHSEVMDIDMNANAQNKVITSAICRSNGKLYIGEEAFEHVKDNSGIRVCFKKEPVAFDGEPELLMTDYMRAIYNRIRENIDYLTDENHLVYLARPSGWTDDHSKLIYQQMALSAGIPLAGLTSESRAAIFYAKQPGLNFSDNIKDGIIVFDLGSSTLDFTYLSEGSQPIDFGYNLGASIIDEVIYESMIYPQVEDFIKRYPIYRDALLFSARKFKERAYGREASSKTADNFSLGEYIIPESDKAYCEFGDTTVKLKINNISELNTLIEDKREYISKIKDAVNNFKTEFLSNVVINGVFLTGGASRMNFIKPLVSQTLSLPECDVKSDKENPSTTISRGIAMLGTADATTNSLVESLDQDLKSKFNHKDLTRELILLLSKEVAENAWVIVENSCLSWVTDGKTKNVSELKQIIELNLNHWQDVDLPKKTNSIFNSFIRMKSTDISKDINDIMSVYAPGRKIVDVESYDIGEIDDITATVDNLPDLIDDMNLSIRHIISFFLSDLFLIAIVSIYVGIFVSLFLNPKRVRQSKVDKIIQRKDSIISKVRSDIEKHLNNNADFNQKVTYILQKYTDSLIDNNLKKVTIPID